jgi:2-polyprenyl-6-methoxyphenol hydroxylase-like FAD-dependent oxidoreductase
MDPVQLRVVIVGGGVAGPALAIALAKTGRPIVTTILEATQPDHDIGTYFTLQDNGVAALKTLGAYEAVALEGYETKRALMYNDRGAVLADINFSGSITVRRSRVNCILSEQATAAGCSVRYGARVARIEEDNREGAVDPVVAVLDDGERVGCDVLVGADGIRSSVRAVIDAAAPKGGSYTGLLNHAGEGPVPAGLEIAPERWHMFFGRQAFFLYHLTTRGTVLWGINEPSAEMMTRERRSAKTEDEWREHFVGLFEGDNGPMQAIIRGSKVDLAGDNTCDMESVGTWSRGRLVLMGDAVHAPSPTSGQGGSMALEDALVLAMCLRDHAGANFENPSRAFAAYEANRRERVEKIVANGRKMSQSKMPGAIGRRIRDLMMPLLFKLVDFEKKGAWITQARIDWDTPLPVNGPCKSAPWWKFGWASQA